VRLARVFGGRGNRSQGNLPQGNGPAQPGHQQDRRSRPTQTICSGSVNAFVQEDHAVIAQIKRRARGGHLRAGEEQSREHTAEPGPATFASFPGSGRAFLFFRRGPKRRRNPPPAFTANERSARTKRQTGGRNLFPSWAAELNWPSQNLPTVKTGLSRGRGDGLRPKFGGVWDARLSGAHECDGG